MLKNITERNGSRIWAKYERKAQIMRGAPILSGQISPSIISFIASICQTSKESWKLLLTIFIISRWTNVTSSSSLHVDFWTKYRWIFRWNAATAEIKPSCGIKSVTISSSGPTTFFLIPQTRLTPAPGTKLAMDTKKLLTANEISIRQKNRSYKSL